MGRKGGELGWSVDVPEGGVVVHGDKMDVFGVGFEKGAGAAVAGEGGSSLGRSGGPIGWGCRSRSAWVGATIRRPSCGVVGGEQALEGAGGDEGHVAEADDGGLGLGGEGGEAGAESWRRGRWAWSLGVDRRWMGRPWRAAVDLGGAVAGDDDYGAAGDGDEGSAGDADKGSAGVGEEVVDDAGDHGAAVAAGDEELVAGRHAGAAAGGEDDDGDLGVGEWRDGGLGGGILGMGWGEAGWGGFRAGEGAGCDVGLRRPPTPMAAMAGPSTSIPAKRRCRTQSMPLSLGERAQPGRTRAGRCADLTPRQMRLPGSTGMPKWRSLSAGGDDGGGADVAAIDYGAGAGDKEDFSVLGR